MKQSRVILLALPLAELLVLGLSAQLRSDKQQGAEQFFSYDYSKHGTDWTAGSCASRARQSPINLPPTAPVVGTFTYKYNPIIEPFEVMNNGHAFSADLAGMGYGGIMYDDAYYNLLNINVHSLSEHAWNGVQQPLELHLVHKRYDNEQLLIVNIAVESPMLTGPALAARTQAAGQPGGSLVQSNASSFLRASGKQAPQLQEAWSSSQYVEPPTNDPGYNPLLAAFLKLPPPPVNMKVQVPADAYNSYDLNALMQGGLFYEYAGSLTAPPCAEIATWMVKKLTIKASDKQVMYLHDAVYKSTADFGNYRELMPLNGRKIQMRQAMIEELPRGAEQPVPMPGNPQQSDREFRAMKWSMDAMTIAKSSVDYIKDLDSRLRNAAAAHAEALSPDMVPLKVNGTAAAPSGFGRNVGNLQSPEQMEATARDMAHTLATAARAEIDDANKQISERSKTIAMDAARQAAGIVGSGVGDINGYAYAVPTKPPPPGVIGDTAFPPGGAAAGVPPPGGLAMR